MNLNDNFKGLAADRAVFAAVRALLCEVAATPKPGLVDRANSGSHKDMDFFTFMDSSAALIPWFRNFFCTGWEYGDESDRELFCRLRFAGLQAETAMFSATGGVNTHKGLVFAFAILCGSLGREYGKGFKSGKEAPVPLETVIEGCRRLGQCSLNDFEPGAGKRFPSASGISGARKEAADGFPSALHTGLPSLRLRLAQGFSLNDAAVLTLLALLSRVEDTNMLRRGGPREAEKARKEALELLEEITPETFLQKTASLDQSFIKRNLSPGGCADLLAVSLMLCFLEDSGMVTEV